MSTWTDDELGELLRETLRDHEHPDDADRAIRIARSAAYPAPRRRVLPTIAAVAAGIVVVGGLVGLARYAGQHDLGGTSASSSAGGAAETAPAPAAASPAANRSAAQAEVQRLLAEVPLPHGAVRKHGAPPAALPVSSGGPANQDRSLTRTAWWTVPVPPSDVTAYVAAHTPPGTSVVSETHWRSNGSRGIDAYLEGTSTNAYTAPWLQLTWTRLDGGTAFRATAYIDPRLMRSPQSVVTGPVTTVDVRARSAGGGVTVAHYGDAATIGQLRRLFNGLPAAGQHADSGGASTFPSSGFALPAAPPRVTLTFHLADGGIVRVRADGGAAGGIQVTRNGRLVSPPLDPTGFLDAVDAIAK